MPFNALLMRFYIQPRLIYIKEWFRCPFYATQPNSILMNANAILKSNTYQRRECINLNFKYGFIWLSDI